jgi:putative transposase
LPVEAKRRLIEPTDPRLSISRQCVLVGLPRSTWYYQSCRDDTYNELLMRLIDAQHTRRPVYGVERMVLWLARQGHVVNVKRVRQLTRQMGLAAIYPKRHLSVPSERAVIYPYRLRGLAITRPDQVWATDITYIRQRRGWAYLVAIMDWFSRYVLAWEVSASLDVDFCLTCLDAALSRSRPEIFNSDQGSQFTSQAFTSRLQAAQVAISMDGRGRVFDNIFIERLWRSVKYEEVYLHDYEDTRETRRGVGSYLTFYNDERLHQSLGGRTPAEVYYGRG